jgi:hypothetical protein
MELLLSRSWLIRVCNLSLYLAFCAAAGSGLVMEYRLPRGRSHRGLELLGLDRHEWGTLHFYLSFTTLALVVLHLALHWAWLKKVAAQARLWPLVVGLGLGLLLVLGPLLLPLGPSTR